MIVPEKKSKMWIVYVIIAVIVIVMAVLLVPRILAARAAATQTSYQTEVVAKGDLTAYIGATGTVRSNQSAVLTWQTSGKVSVINVSKGDNAAANAVLAQLDTSSLPQNLILTQATLVNDQKALDNLINSQVPAAQARQNVDNAQKALDDYNASFITTQAQAQKALADANDAYNTAHDARANLNAATAGDQSTIATAQATVLSLQKQVNDAQTAFDKVSSYDVTDLTRANALATLQNLKQQLKDAENNLATLQGSPTAKDIAQADAKLAQAQANLTTAQDNWDRVKDGADPADKAILEAQLADAQRAYDRIKNGPNPDDVAAAQAMVAADKAALDQANLKAPFAGAVTVVNSKAGDMVSPGTLAFQIDDLSSLFVNIDISEVDIAKVAVGQPVVLTFDALLGKEFNGKVTDIALVGKNSGGTVSFTVTVQITDQTTDIKPGMTAGANIAVNQLQNVILVSNRAIRTINGARVIYVLKNGVAQQLTITLGASSNTQSEVTSGNLQIGDQIILNPPTTTTLGPGVSRTGGGTLGGG
jgi:HlyD family secretion protein